MPDSVDATLSQQPLQESPIDRVLSLLPGYRSYARGYTAHCPAHNDGHNSLMIWEDEDGHVGIKCYTGCSRKAVCYALGIPETDLYVRSKNYKPRFQKHSLDIMAFALAKGIHPHHLTNWGVIEGHNFRGWKNILRIAYYNLDGSEYSKYRIRTGLEGDVFLWEGKGEIIPYGLDRLGSTKEYIVFPEGESCTWTLWQWGFNALGIPGVEQVKSLQAEHVALLPLTVYLIQEPPSGPGKPEAGKKFVANMTARLKELGYQGKVLIIDLKASHDVKDANELNQKLMNEGRMRDFKKEFQQAIEQAISVNDTDLSEQMRPDFIIEGQLRTQVKRAIEVLKLKNEQDTRLFVYLSTISKVEYDEKDDPMIIQLEKAALRNELSDAADFKIWKKDQYVDAHPPKDLAEQLLALAPRKWGLPPLKAIVEAPVLRSDGSILTAPGYDEKTGLYYIPSPGMERCVIPENPSQQDAIEAMSHIKALFADFPFEGQADYANTIALLFTPFVRYAVKRDIQMALVDATNAGTGKGLISIVVSIVATGRPTTPLSAKQNDEEWRKAIFAELLRAPRIVIIDNIRQVLESATLELMLTGNGLNERILGHSKSASPKNEATWMATGNNLLIGGDLPRRCYRIRLISKTATPEERDDFAIKDLEQHTLDTRPQYVSDVLTVARAWYVAGKPQPTKVPNLGTFTDWAKTVGGMLEFAGIEGFQSNRVELRSRNNEEAQQWEAFLSAWSHEYKSDWNFAGTVAKVIKDQSEKAKENNNSLQPPATLLFDSLPLDLKKALAEKPNSFHVTLARQLGERVQTVYGSHGYRIERDEDSHSKQKLWRVMRVVAGGSTPSSESEKKSDLPENETQADVTMSSAHSGFSENINGGFNHPQPPATSAESKTRQTQSRALTGSTSGFKDLSSQSESSEVAGGLSEQITQYSVGEYPTEYMALFTDYKIKVRNNPLDSLMWMAPDQKYTNQMKEKEKHIQFTQELLCSGIDRRVRAAVEAMKRTLDIWED